MSAKPIPDGYHTVTPYLIVDGAVKAIEFYTKVFGACEAMRLEMGDKLAHAEIQIGRRSIGDQVDDVSVKRVSQD